MVIERTGEKYKDFSLLPLRNCSLSFSTDSMMVCFGIGHKSHLLPHRWTWSDWPRLSATVSRPIDNVCHSYKNGHGGMCPLICLHWTFYNKVLQCKSTQHSLVLVLVISIVISLTRTFSRRFFYPFFAISVDHHWALLIVYYSLKGKNLSAFCFVSVLWSHTRLLRPRPRSRT